MELCIKRFEELTLDELYEIIRLRIAVFVVEQNCIYQDLDDKDRSAYHVFLKEDDRIQAYLRVLDKGVAFEDVAIGRVISAKRRCGLGSRVLAEGIRVAYEKLNAKRIVLHAQTYARAFYEQQGFVQSSEEFLEDDIPHIEMTLELHEPPVKGRTVFLTSSPCDDDVPDGVELPCIFFERNEFVRNMRRAVIPGARFTVVAADPENFSLNDEMTATFASCFRYHGMNLSSVSLVDARTVDRAAELIANSDLLMLGGGHVPTEWAFFEKIGLKELLQEYRGVVMGVSAGSMNCASTVYSQPEMPGESADPDYRRFFPGLGLTDVMVLPHYQRERNTILDGKRLYEDITYADSMGRVFIAIPDGSYVLVEDGRAMLYGEGYHISDGAILRICDDGASFAL